MIGLLVWASRPGEIRDRSFEQQRYRDSRLKLVTAAVVLWNTVYLEWTAHALRGNDYAVDDAAIPVAAGLGAHQPDRRYLWRSSAKMGARKLRPLQPA